MARQAASMVILADTLPLAAVCTLHEWTSMMFPVAATDRRCTNSVRLSIVQVLLRLPTNTTALQRLGGAAATSCQLSSFMASTSSCSVLPVSGSTLPAAAGRVSWLGPALAAVAPKTGLTLTGRSPVCIRLRILHFCVPRGHCLGCVPGCGGATGTGFSVGSLVFYLLAWQFCTVTCTRGFDCPGLLVRALLLVVLLLPALLVSLPPSLFENGCLTAILADSFNDFISCLKSKTRPAS